MRHDCSCRARHGLSTSRSPRGGRRARTPRCLRHEGPDAALIGYGEAWDSPTARPYIWPTPTASRRSSGRLLLPQLVDALEALGLEVWEPFERNNQVDLSEAGWAYRIGQADFRDVRDADAIFAVVNGVPPDEGVMVELGMAIALGKPTFLFRDDFRRATDSEEYPLNLMLFTGMPRWRAGATATTRPSQRSSLPTRPSHAGRAARPRPPPAGGCCRSAPGTAGQESQLPVDM